MKAPILASFVSLLLLPSLACGPTVAVETGEDDGSMGSTTEPVVTTTNTAPPATSVGPTTTPGDTTIGPEDTGLVDTGIDTGEMWLDLPEWCSQIEQDCPPGYKCMPYANDGGSSWNATRCVPLVPDPNAPGEPCTVEGNGVSGLDDCDGTSMCWDVDTKTNEGTCTPFCIGDESNPTCADRCDHCSISGDGVLTLCLTGCDPITQNCGPGQACYPINSRFACAPDASLPDTGILSPCEYINACPPGLFCLAADAVPGCEGGLGCCAPVCAVGGTDPCPGLLPGSECTPWFEEGQEPPEACIVADPGVCVTPS